MPQFRLLLAAFAATVTAGAMHAQDTTFQFEFFDQFPLGGGQVTIANDPGDGTYALSTVDPISMNFSFFWGDSFTQADIVSDLSMTEVVISNLGPFQTLQFSDTGTMAGGGGPLGGSIDFENASGEGLSFEPSWIGGYLDTFQEGDVNSNSPLFGGYIAFAVPAPDSASTFALAGISALALAVGAGWSRRKSAVSA
ncbi:MAG TPA: hypothetical protein VGL42_16070 [Opitutaceae bacterium]|jgi:hypothetical protein